VEHGGSPGVFDRGVHGQAAARIMQRPQGTTILKDAGLSTIVAATSLKQEIRLRGSYGKMFDLPKEGGAEAVYTSKGKEKPVSSK